MSDRLRVLLIGGSGFLGRHVAAALREAGHAVTVMSRGARPLPAGVEALVAAREDRGALSRALDGGPLVLPDGGASLTRFLWAGDVGRFVVQLAAATPRSAVYNLAQPDAMPLRDYLEHVARAAGVSPRFVAATWDECRAAGLDR